MSRDSSRTYIHLRKPHHADLFECIFPYPNAYLYIVIDGALTARGFIVQDFTSLNPTNSATSHTPSAPGATTAPSTTNAHPNLPSAQMHPFAPSAAPIHNPTPLGNTPHLAPEDIYVPPQHQPPNPEDEDDVVPDQHAAFGITRAMALREGQRGQGDGWRDFESLRERVRGEELRVNPPGTGPVSQQPQQLQTQP